MRLVGKKKTLPAPYCVPKRMENNMPEKQKTSTLTLITNQKKDQKLMITVATKKGSDARPVDKTKLSNDLVRMTFDELNGLEVEYEMKNGLLRKVWKKGGEWQDETETPKPAVFVVGDLSPL